MKRSLLYLAVTLILIILSSQILLADFNPTRTILDDAFHGGWSVATGDMDNDGDMDVVAAASYDDQIAWFRNNGDGTFSNRFVIDNGTVTGLDGPTSVAVGDIDGDGWLDVVAVGENSSNIGWYRNLGATTPGTFSARNDVTTTFDNPATIRLGDIDGDLDLDIIAVRSNISNFNPLSPTPITGEVAWFENDNPVSGLWTKHDIDTNFPGTVGVDVGYIDDDDALDVVVAAVTVNNPLACPIGCTLSGDVAWFSNNGDGSAFGARQAIDTNLVGANFVTVGDVDGDTDIDVIATSTDLLAAFQGTPTPTPGEVVVYKNDGSGTFATKQSLDATIATVGVITVDLDLDGDLDVVTASPLEGQINWFDNVNGDASTWSKNSIDNTFSDAINLAAGDLDGDGDPDIVGVAGQDNTPDIGEIAWWRNLEDENPPVLVVNTGLTVAEDAGPTPITDAMLKAEDTITTDPADIVFTLTELPQGALSLNGVALTTSFTQKDIDDGLIAYDPNGMFDHLNNGQNASDPFKFTLSDGTNISTEMTFTVTVTGVGGNGGGNSAPVVSANNPLTVDQGEIGTITNAHLLYTDADNTAAQLTYTVTSGPTNGTLSLTTFTQASINAGLVTYTHNNSATTSDSFAFNLSDGTNTVSGTFNIIITPQDGEPGPDPDVPPGPGETDIVGNLNSGSIFPTIRWTPLNDANDNPIFGDWYNIVIVSNGVVVLDIWLPVYQVCSSVTCAYTLTPDDLPAGLLNGDYTVQIRAWTDDGTPSGNMGEFMDGFPFSVTVPISTGVVVNDVSSKPYVEITLEGDHGAAWYHIWIGTHIGNTYTSYFFGWIPKPADCDGLTPCVIRPFAHLPNGTYELWMQTWGPGGFNQDNPGAWMQGPNIEMDFDAPALIEPITPTSNVNSGRPTFSWNTDGTATWFNVWVGTTDYTETKFFDWFWSLDLGCENALTCTAVPNAVLDNSTSYTWFVRAWGPGGFTSGGEFDGWSKGDEFTVNAGTTGIPTLLTPNGTVSDTSPTYTWEAVENGSWYRVQIESAGGAVLYDNWHAAETIGCNGGGVCALTPGGLYLDDGGYRWFVTAYSPGGLGNRSAAQNFAVQR